jgi:hypothetical protein
MYTRTPVLLRYIRSLSPSVQALVNIFDEGNIEYQSIKKTFQTRIMPLSTLHNGTSFDSLEIDRRNFGADA